MTELNACFRCFVICYFLAILSGYVSACPTGCQCNNEAPYLTSCIDRNLADIPTDIPLQTEELYLKGNRIKTLSEGAFRDLVNLQRLVFTHNRLESLEANAFVGLTKLIHLDLRWNNLSSLPSFAFSGLDSLKMLELDFNDIQSVAESAFNGLNLTKLGLESNRKLVEIHPDAFKDSSLLNLFLYGSNLQSQSAEAFRELSSSLQELSWFNNQQPITLPANLFKDFKLVRLKLVSIGLKDVSFLKHVKADEVSLMGNPVGPIDFTRFPLLSSVRSLYLDDTNSSHIKLSHFNNLRQLENLHLESNGITTVPENMKSFFSRLKSLKFDGNPFHCNCELIWLKQWLGSAELKVDITGIQCSTPFFEDLSSVDEERLQCSAPSMVNITKDITVYQDATLTITCLAEGDPTPQIHWILPDGRLRPYGPTFNRTETIVRKDFQKNGARLSDAGIYRCVAMNLLGNDSSVAVVKVLPLAASSSPSTYNLQQMVILLSHFVAGVIFY